jgi:exonuclease-1
MDQDLAAKEKKHERSQSPKRTKILTESRFFGGPSNSAPNLQDDLVVPIAGPSRLVEFVEDEKENVPMSDEDLDFAMDLPDDPVTQEDGYMSPAPSFSRLDTPDLSSPLRPGATRTKRECDDGFDDFGADTISSPVAPKVAPRHPSRSIEKLEWSQDNILDRDTPVVSDQNVKRATRIDGPDLRDTFDDDITSEIDCFDEDTLDTTPPITPDDSGRVEEELGMDIDDLEPDLELEAEAIDTRTEIVANGWWAKWGRAGKDKEGKFRVRVQSIPMFTWICTEAHFVETRSTQTRN